MKNNDTCAWTLQRPRAILTPKAAKMGPRLSQNKSKNYSKIHLERALEEDPLLINFLRDVSSEIYLCINL